MIKEEIIKQLQEVFDPEISINVYDLGAQELACVSGVCEI